VVSGAAADGSAFMMLTGGIEAADGKNTFGPGTRKPLGAGAGPEASPGDVGKRPATGGSAAAGQVAA
jgi:hypothetical protein